VWHRSDHNVVKPDRGWSSVGVTNVTSGEGDVVLSAGARRRVVRLRVPVWLRTLHQRLVRWNHASLWWWIATRNAIGAFTNNHSMHQPISPAHISTRYRLSVRSMASVLLPLTSIVRRRITARYDCHGASEIKPRTTAVDLQCNLF